MHTVGVITIFDDRNGNDEDAFIQLCNSNEGYVANIGRGANRHDPVKVHFDTCSWLNSERVARRGYTSGDYYKAWSPDGQTLAQWVQTMHLAGDCGEPSDCEKCHPGLLP